MYSPRSVSTTLRPAASMARSKADSSLTIDFDLMIFATPWRFAISSTWRFTSAGVSAQVAEDDGVGPGVEDMLALVVRHAGRDVTELDRERPAKAAAGLAIGHFGHLDAGHFTEQRTRLLLDVHFSQSGAAIVVGDLPG